MAGVAGSQPSNLNPQVPVEPTPQAAPMPQGSPAPAETPAPASAAPVPAADPLDSLADAHASATPDPLDALADTHAAASEPETSTTHKVLDAAGRVLDYAGGNIRTAVATAAGLATGKNVVSDEDVTNTLKGKAPTSAEYMKRLGVDEGPAFTIPGIGHVSLRDVEGTAMDIATDPLTAVTKLAKEVPYIGKLMNAPNALSDMVGKWVYNSAFNGVDAKLAKKGVGPLSELMAEKGVTGGAKDIEAATSNMANEMGNLRQTMYDKAESMGAKVDLADPGIMKRTDSVIAAMKRDPGLRPQASELEDMLNRYRQAGPVSLADASEFKTNLYNALPASAFDGFGKAKSTAMRFKAALATDLRQGIVDAGNTAEKGLGDAIAKTNDKWGVLISAKKPVSQMANSPGSGLGHMIDMTLLGSGHVQGLAAKKALELGTGTYARTKIGAALSAAGRDGVASDIARRALIDSQQPPQEPQE